MGLDIEIYKENRKGKRQYVDFFGNNGWCVLTYLEAVTEQEVNDLYVTIPRVYIEYLIEKCKNVLISYYDSTFEYDSPWIAIAKEQLPITKNAADDEYNQEYIDSVSTVYTVFLNLYKEMYDDESVVLKISY